jgi:hypothetical protein
MMKNFQAVCRRRRRKIPGKSVGDWTPRRAGRSIKNAGHVAKAGAE